MAHADRDLRVVVLSGAGKVFSAGADANWMARMIDYSRDENVRDATRMAEMFLALDTLPAAVIGRIHGAALGGGAGLTAICDIAVADEDAMFGFTETKLGILPGGDLTVRPAEDRARRPRASCFSPACGFPPRVPGRSAWCTRSVAADELDATVERYVDRAAVGRRRPASRRRRR